MQHPTDDEDDNLPGQRAIPTSDTQFTLLFDDDLV